MLINLDPNFAPLGKGAEFKSWLFSGGEVGFKLSDSWVTTAVWNKNHYSDTKVIITCRLTNSDRVMELLMATDALRRLGFKDIEVFVPYLPYGRQDRVMVEGESLSLRVFADLINAQGYSNVAIFDCHSDVGPALLNNVVNVSNHKFVYRVLSHHKGPIGDNFWLVVPDSGALKKAYGVAKAIGYHDYGLIKCDKERDVSDGRILSTTVNRGDLNSWDCWIVDDCADGAMTFIKLAEELKKRNCGKVYLVVSHGIFSKGYDLPNIDHIFTTNSFKDIDHPRVTQIKLDFSLLS